MDRKIVIIGNGIYAKMMQKYIDNTGYGVVCAYSVDEKYIDEKIIDGIPVISFEDLRKKYDNKEVGLILGIGYSKMGEVRKRIYNECIKWGYEFLNYIHPTAIIASDAIIGNGNNILEGVIIEAGTCIGNANLIYGGSIISHDCYVGDYNTFSVKSVVAGCTNIMNNCFLGASSVVRDKVTIKNYVLVGAAAYAFKDMEEYSVIVPEKSRIVENKKSIDYL